jgi:hypothetical protein
MKHKNVIVTNFKCCNIFYGRTCKEHFLITLLDLNFKLVRKSTSGYSKHSFFFFSEVETFLWRPREFIFALLLQLVSSAKSLNFFNFFWSFV